VSRDDLARVRRRFVELQGRRKFGTLLEEAGLVRRPVLRRCLLLHARAALAKLIEEAPTTVVGVEPIRLDADEELTFELKELMRSECQTETSATWADFRAWTDENIALTPLSEVPGYRACAVLTVDGRVVTAQSASAENDPSLIAIFLTTVLEHSTSTMTSAGVGAVNLVLLECEQGTVIARWIDPERRRLLAALLDPEGNLGMAKLRMQELVPKLALLVHR
jgi:predicted regulator of Ras-like GTPase activity (Roadblock/LC7/MglB family)